MKLLIIGATRGIGLCLLQQALDAGHEVTALAREPGSIAQSHPLLRVVRGNALDAGALAQAVRGQDAVAYTLGIGPTRKPVTVFSSSTGLLLDAMHHQGVKRLVAVTGIGAGDSKGHGGFVFDRLILPLLLKPIFEDKDRQEDLIRASGADWTIVRPGLLGNGPKTGKVRVVHDMVGITARKVSRADTASYMLQALENGADMGKTVFVDQG